MKQYSYEQTCKYYDLLETSEKDNKERNSFLERAFKKYKIKSIFDLTCGTGAQAIYFLKKGYKIKASDYSKGMIDVANDKLHKLKRKEKFLVGDMRTIKFGKADAVITMFNAIGHLSKTDFEKALSNFKENLKPKGYYIFDIYNLNEMPNGLPKHKHIDNVVSKDNLYIVRYCTNKLNMNTGKITTIHEWHIQQDMNPYNIIKNKWDMQLYVYKELKEILERNGFKVLEVYGNAKMSKFKDKTSESIYLITQKQ
ncbi:MAG TPA: class I SAM-dependent methyltransferase [archaeon]|nr:class I SAM-dependent methyltransferase [archaeon]